jgi:hypothetical protein
VNGKEPGKRGRKKKTSTHEINASVFRKLIKWTQTTTKRKKIGTVTLAVLSFLSLRSFTEPNKNILS